MRKIKKKTRSTKNTVSDVNKRVKGVKGVKGIKGVKKKRLDQYSVEEVKEAMSRPLRKRYKKQKCAFVDENGKRCKRNAVGKSTLCKKHGGNPVVVEDLIPDSRAGLVPRSKFNPAYHPIAFVSLAKEGMSEVEIAAKFEISVGTLRRWSETYESFSIAYDIGKTMNEAWWQTRGKEALGDRFFNTSLFKFMTSNLLGYSDKMETKSTNMNLHGVLVVPDPMSEEEWEAANKEDAIDVDYEIEKKS